MHSRASDAADGTVREALRVSESRYRRLFETAQDGILLLNADTAQIEDVNPCLIHLLGYSHAEFLGRKLWEVVSSADRAESEQLFAELQTKGFVRRENLPLETKAGARIEVEFVSNAYDCEGIKVIQCNIRDISERKAAAAKFQRHAHLYAALSQTNKAIVHCTSEQELFQQVCRAAVQFGGMKMAWIGLVDPQTLTVRPVASFGDDAGYLDAIKVSADAGNPFSGGPTGTVIRENRLYWCQDFKTDPKTAPWREHAARAGLAASASLPLCHDGRVVGAFTLYSGEIGAFDEAARALLSEMATDIGFALDNFTRESRRQQAEEQLLFQNAILKTQQETSLDAILVVDESGKIISHNHQFIALWRLSPQLVNERVDALVLQSVVGQLENAEAFVARIRYLNTHRSEASHDEMRLKDGRTIERYSAPCNGSDGRHYGRVWYFRDITERKQAETRVADLSRVHAVLSGINALIVRAGDRDELFRESCRIAVEAAGFRMSMLAMIDRETGKVVPVASAGKSGELMTDVRNILASDQLAPTTMVSRAIREKRPIVSNDSLGDPQLSLGNKYIQAGVRSLVVLPLQMAGHVQGVLALYAGERNFFHDEELNLLQGLAGDIAFAIDHIDKRERLNYLAYYDVLTGLANRSLFLERLAQNMRNTPSGTHKLAIALIDLERFKNINDSLGRPAGDALLKQVTEWLTRRTGDASLLARIETDHFAVMLPGIGQDEDVARSIERMIEAFVDNPFRLNDAVFRITPKVGAAVFPEDGVNADTLFRNAEAALKQAKAGGDRYLFYTGTMTAAVASKLSLENQLRAALDDERFVLHYQPKTDIASGRITSVEALIRWNDPGNGLVLPDQFIPILEETGLINEVGRWALHQAAADYLRWLGSGLAAVRIAVNVSPLQLRNRGFIDDIRQVVGSDARLADALELEITESLIMADVRHSIASLQAIRAMGVSIAIDDFGTGFSSLSYLAKFPVDTLKIDRSFIVDMTARPEGLALVATIINLAHSLKLKVVAEGVETGEQLRLLRLLNCDEMQGFLFSESVPSAILEARFLSPHGVG
ncbi:MAG: EAL domain-containing protein [Xanthomonadaceae bacterium]|nr:EAL domain-containing protein [Xanthomonadaceae bacterium]